MGSLTPVPELTALLRWPRFSKYVRADADDQAQPWNGWFFAGGERRAPLVITKATRSTVVAALAKVVQPLPVAPRRPDRVSRTGEDLRVEMLLAFYADYGLLGQSSLIPEGRTARFAGRVECRMGDNFIWALDHAANVNKIMRAISAVEWPALRDELRLHPRVYIPLPAPPWRQPMNVRQMSRTEFIAAGLNPTLQTITEFFDATAGEPRKAVRTLVEVIYEELLERASGATESDDLRRCQAPDCRAFFFAKDPRKRFCPGPPGAASRCAARERMRRKRRQEPARGELP